MLNTHGLELRDESFRLIFATAVRPEMSNLALELSLDHRIEVIEGELLFVLRLKVINENRFRFIVYVCGKIAGVRSDRLSLHGPVQVRVYQLERFSGAWGR